MRVPRLVVAFAAIAALAPSAASAAAQQEIDESVAAGAAWIAHPAERRHRAAHRLRRRLRAVGARRGGRPPGRRRRPVGAGLLRRRVGGPDHAELDGDPLRLRRRPRRPAAVGVDQPRRPARGRLQPPTTSLGNGATNLTAFSALALARVGAPAAALARINGYLRGQQHLDGGWNFGRVTTDAQRATAGSVDMTGAVLAALCETGAAANDPDVRAGLSFLEGRQDAPPAASATSTRPAGRCPAQRCGIDPQGRALHHRGEHEPRRLPDLPAGPERRVPVQRRAQPLLDPERGPRAGRRGLLGRPAAARDRRRPALPRRAGRRRRYADAARAGHRRRRGRRAPVQRDRTGRSDVAAFLARAAASPRWRPRAAS